MGCVLPPTARRLWRQCRRCTGWRCRCGNSGSSGSGCGNSRCVERRAWAARAAVKGIPHRHGATQAAPTDAVHLAKVVPSFHVPFVGPLRFVVALGLGGCFGCAVALPDDLDAEGTHGRVGVNGLPSQPNNKSHHRHSTAVTTMPQSQQQPSSPKSQLQSPSKDANTCRSGGRPPPPPPPPPPPQWCPQLLPRDKRRTSHTEPDQLHVPRKTSPLRARPEQDTRTLHTKMTTARCSR